MGGLSLQMPGVCMCPLPRQDEEVCRLSIGIELSGPGLRGRGSLQVLSVQAMQWLHAEHHVIGTHAYRLRIDLMYGQSEDISTQASYTHADMYLLCVLLDLHLFFFQSFSVTTLYPALHTVACGVALALWLCLLQLLPASCLESLLL
jgi:hypothetical protein